MQQLKARLDKVEEQMRLEQAAIIDSVKNDYETALKTEEYLATRTEEQKLRAMDLEEKATQYKILERRWKPTRLFTRACSRGPRKLKQPSGAAVTNVQIIDYARPPLYPFKPRVALNLALGLVIGVVGGIGMAFLFEYFDNTIKNPDEMIDRFGIPGSRPDSL